MEEKNDEVEEEKDKGVRMMEEGKKEVEVRARTNRERKDGLKEEEGERRVRVMENKERRTEVDGIRVMEEVERYERQKKRKKDAMEKEE